MMVILSNRKGNKEKKDEKPEDSILDADQLHQGERPVPHSLGFLLHRGRDEGTATTAPFGDHVQSRPVSALVTPRQPRLASFSTPTVIPIIALDKLVNCGYGFGWRSFMKTPGARSKEFRTKLITYKVKQRFGFKLFGYSTFFLQKGEHIYIWLDDKGDHGYNISEKGRVFRMSYDQFDQISQYLERVPDSDSSQKVVKDDHAGQVYNPITGEWRWF